MKTSFVTCEKLVMKHLRVITSFILSTTVSDVVASKRSRKTKKSRQRTKIRKISIKTTVEN